MRKKEKKAERNQANNWRSPRETQMGCTTFRPRWDAQPSEKETGEMGGEGHGIKVRDVGPNHCFGILVDSLGLQQAQNSDWGLGRHTTRTSGR